MSLVTKFDREFKKDIQRDRMCGAYREKDFAKLRNTIGKLVEMLPLDAALTDHSLKGNYQGYRECHIKPDWLLVYKIDLESNTLNLARLGTHNQIFNR